MREAYVYDGYVNEMAIATLAAKSQFHTPQTHPDYIYDAHKDLPRNLHKHSEVSPDRFLSIDPVTFGMTVDPQVIIKGGDIGSVVAGAVADTKTLTGKNVSLGRRIGAGASLATEIFSPVSARDAKAGANYAGGAYKKLTGKSTPSKPIECHHCPANSVSPLSKGDGPSIQMDKADHRQTASYGNSKDAQAYRQQQSDLIDQGDFTGAQQMDIDDVQSKFGNKYDGAIKEMQDYTKEIDP